MFKDSIGYKVSEEGKTFLQGLHNRIGIIAVAGKYRTGKSFLLNRIIMGKLKGGFGVGSTINACTKVRLIGCLTHGYVGNMGVERANKDEVERRERRVRSAGHG